MNEFDNVPASIAAMINLPLWGIVIKSTLAIALAALACKLLNRQSAALRHRVWVFGLAASLIVPLASLLLPQVTLHVLPTAMNASNVATVQESESVAVGGPSRSIVPRPADGMIANNVTARSESTSSSRKAKARSKSVQGAGEGLWTIGGSPGIQRWFVLCWLLGTLLSSALFLTSLARQSIWLRRLRRIDDADWNSSVTAAAGTLGLRQTIVALESEAACVPAVVGVLNPRLVVPANWRTWSPTQRHCILLHELAHIKRCDVSTQLLGRLALLAHWFNPLVWHAVKQLRAERELASDDCVLLAGQTASDYAEELLRTLRCYRPVRPAIGVAMAHSARLDQRVLAILDPQRRRDPVGSRFAILLSCIVAVCCTVLGGITLSTRTALANQPAMPQPAVVAQAAKPVWKENVTIDYPGTLPVSVAFSGDGKTLLTGDTNGEVMALLISDNDPRYRWKSKVDGSHAAVAFSVDQKKVYVTSNDGVRILDSAWGKEEALIEEKDSRPTAIGVFPNKKIAEDFTQLKIAFCNPRSCFAKSWADGKLPDSIGTIEVGIVKQDVQPEDNAAVPLAVDPQGRSAIMTGPIDGTGDLTGMKGKNVLWAYVCGDYEAGSPGNRIMVGHTAPVVSAAWAKEGSTAVTGDAAGRVIVWDAKTMKETRRLELGGRIGALAISDDGQRTAAYVLGKVGTVYVWETAKPVDAMQPIHTELVSFEGPTSYASLSFTPDGKQLAGCATDKRMLNFSGRLIGKVRVWELSAAPQAQLPPKHAYTKQFPKGSSTNVVIVENHVMFTPDAEEGAINMLSVRDGGVMIMHVLGEFIIDGMKLSFDRKWLAMELHGLKNKQGGGVRSATFDVAVCPSMPAKISAKIPACRQLLDIAAGGTVVAVVREKQVELWDIATSKMLKAAPFPFTRIDAACFSPDGQVLAISDRNELVLWRWEPDTHERMELGRRVGSLAFSPDGKFLAEGPTPGDNIQIRDVETRKVVRTLTNGTKRSMNVPRLAYAQSGRVLIACDDALGMGIALPPRINLWDTADGTLAHQLTIPSGLPKNLAVSPNGMHLVAMLEDTDGVKLSTWRLDGQATVADTGPKPPAAPAKPR